MALDWRLSLTCVAGGGGKGEEGRREEKEGKVEEQVRGREGA